MIIGVLKEVLEGEFRVAATPETVKKLTILNHKVYIESNAGIGASITNQMFIDAGGVIKSNADVFKADLLLKVRAPNIDETKNSPLAKQLFHLPFVKEVFLDTNYVSITKYEVAEWETVVMEVREFIRSFIEEGNIVLTESPTPLDIEKKEQPEANLNPIEQQIVSILDEYIKPAVASDGGNIVFDSYNETEKSVHVVLQGACSGCPSSTFTLKNGIENMLKEMMPGKITSVVAVNG